MGNPSIRPFQGAPSRWLGQALALGALPTAAMAVLFWHAGWPSMLVNAAVGALCAVVVWGGYELASPWLLDHPRRCTPGQAALLALAKWIPLYSVLIFFCIWGISRFLRVDLWNPWSVTVTYLLGLMLSTVVVNVRGTAALVATARELERTRAHAAMLALKAQLSPHTLFNSLNAVTALIGDQPEAAERAMEHLSGLLRRVLQALDQESWTLGEELELVRDLLELEKARFGDRLSYQLSIAEADQGRPIPPLLLLPLVENSLKHGFRPKVGPCRLRLEVRGPRIRLEDDGVGRRPDAPEGIGLRSVRTRLEAVRGTLAWPASAAGCVVEVRL
jgi:signal transduction histidine kinase